MATRTSGPVDIEELYKEFVGHNSHEEALGTARSGGLGTVMPMRWILLFKLVKAVYQLHKRVEALEPSQKWPYMVALTCEKCGTKDTMTRVASKTEGNPVYQCPNCGHRNVHRDGLASFEEDGW